jgi:hypothetical protein
MTFGANVPVTGVSLPPDGRETCVLLLSENSSPLGALRLHASEPPFQNIAPVPQSWVSLDALPLHRLGATTCPCADRWQPKQPDMAAMNGGGVCLGKRAAAVLHSLVRR